MLFSQGVASVPQIALHIFTAWENSTSLCIQGGSILHLHKLCARVCVWWWLLLWWVYFWTSIAARATLIHFLWSLFRADQSIFSFYKSSSTTLLQHAYHSDSCLIISLLWFFFFPLIPCYCYQFKVKQQHVINWPKDNSFWLISVTAIRCSGLAWPPFEWISRPFFGGLHLHVPV